MRYGVKVPKPLFKVGEVVTLDPKRFPQNFIGTITLVEQGAKLNFCTVRWDVEPSVELIHEEHSLIKLPTDSEIKASILFIKLAKNYFI
jgi:hypothetical protein